MPRVVEKIIGRLEHAGFEAYAVGGCVRDSLLGRIPEDWDITTSARPEEVKRVFHRTVDTGIEHGTVTVMMGGEDTLLQGVHGYEVTTYRIDGAYLDGRHPSSVAFTPSLREDLARRDFTINAMAYNPRTGIVDVFGGIADLQAGVIRAVGTAQHRFEEDALRMLRALRFSAQLGFYIEEETFAAVKLLAPKLGQVSKERIAVELSKLLMSAHPNRIRLVFDTGLAPYICRDFSKIEQMGDAVLLWQTSDAGRVPWLPTLSNIARCARQDMRAEAKKNAALDMRKRTDTESEGDMRLSCVQDNAADAREVRFVDAAPCFCDFHEKKYLVWGLLLRAVPAFAKTILRELKLDNDTIRQADVIAALFSEPVPETAKDVRVCLSRVGYDLFFDYLAAREAIAEAGAQAAMYGCNDGFSGMETGALQGYKNTFEMDGISALSHQDQEQKAASWEAEARRMRRVRALTREIQMRGDCIDLKGLAVSGQDLMDAGVEKGPNIGRILKAMLAEVLDDPSANQKEILLARHVG